MVFYLVNIFILFLYGLLIVKSKLKNANKTFVIIASIHLGLLMSLRADTVGTDVKSYNYLFYLIGISPDMFNVISSAPLFILYNKAVSFISTDPQWIIIFNSLIIVFGTGLFIYRNSKNILMSFYYYISLYFYFRSFNISRQFIALILVANSFHYLKTRKYIKFLLLIIAATLVHNTAIVGLILFPLSKVKWNNIKLTILAVITTVISLSYEMLLNLFFLVFPRYMNYMNEGIASYEGEGKKIFVSFFYLLLIIISMVALKNKKKENQEKELFTLTSIMIIATVIGIVFYNNSLMSRFEIYFAFFAILFIPALVKYISNKWTRIILYYVLMIITAIPMLVQLHSGISGVIPYKFFWQ